MSKPALLRGVDRAAFAVALATRLRARGVTVGLTGIDDLVRALAANPPTSRSRLYWTARTTLVRRQADLAVFEAVFAALFERAVLPLDPHTRRNRSPDLRPPGRAEEAVDGAALAAGGLPLPWVTRPAVVKAAGEDDDGDVRLPLLRPSARPGSADTPFEDLAPDDVRRLSLWLAGTVASLPTRRSRRMAVDHHGGRVALRPTIARARRTGWEPVRLVRVRPVDRPRRIVMLCDVSQSMQPQASAYLHFMRAVALAADAEVFAFATRVTRLTPVLLHRSAEVAVAQATAKVADRFGGTRIAASIQWLLASHHGGAVRGAVVLIGSDGWDSDPPEQLAAAMARLRRRAHRVLWMNPRATAPSFQPRVGTMAAALPYCDRFLPADTFAALAGVVAELGARSSGTSGRSSALRARPQDVAR